uniref:Uncharacterized protein n=1 Tax=Arundo donax TaxID=35708 RepID=A0A0A9D185_ARUDO
MNYLTRMEHWVGANIALTLSPDLFRTRSSTRKCPIFLLTIPCIYFYTRDGERGLSLVVRTLSSTLRS